MNGRGKYRRWHIWLAWVAAIPILLWVISGLVMVARPIEEVRGEGLLSDPRRSAWSGRRFRLLIAGVPIQSLSLEQRAAGPRWVVKLPDGKTRLADPATGLLLPPLVGERRPAGSRGALRRQGEGPVGHADRAPTIRR